jgi:hypothetical protein
MSDSEENLCAICQNTMSCKAFDSEAEQGGEDGGFRLSCKHAYHSQCILIAFRTSASTACPCCRNTESEPQVVTRGRFSFHVTELEEDGEEDMDLMEVMDNDIVLRKMRTSNPEIKTLRRELKEMRKGYNVFRDNLRKRRRECISKALKDFRTEHRNSFREVQAKLVAQASQIVDREMQLYIEETSQEIYDSLPWKLLHDFQRGRQFKIESSDTRHTDPWNSSFWYA